MKFRLNYAKKPSKTRKRSEVPNFTILQVISRQNWISKYTGVLKSCYYALGIITALSLLSVFFLAVNLDVYTWINTMLFFMCALASFGASIYATGKLEQLENDLHAWLKLFVEEKGRSAVGPLLELLQGGFYRKKNAPLGGKLLYISYIF